MDLQTVIFIGRSGAGKGTQSNFLQEYLKKETPNTPILYIETGSHFRKYIKESGYVWERARAIQESGSRQPDFLAVWIWASIFIEEIKGGEHLIFDGMPRSAPEAKILDTAFPFYQRNNPKIIFLNVSEGWSEERLRGRGRADDLNPEVVAKRLAFFNSDVAPAVDHYRTMYAENFYEINGEQTPEEVFGDVKKALQI